MDGYLFGQWAGRILRCPKERLDVHSIDTRSDFPLGAPLAWRDQKTAAVSNFTTACTGAPGIITLQGRIRKSETEIAGAQRNSL